MPTKTVKYDAKKAVADYWVHVPLGAGQLALEKGKELSEKAVAMARRPRKDWAKLYGDLAKRGEKVVKTARESAYARRAVDQTKVAGTQVQAATSTVRRAIRPTRAVKAQAKKAS